MLFRIISEWNGTDQNNNQYGTRIYFEENEIHTVFEKMYEKSKDVPTELMLTIDKYNSDITIALQNASESIDIKKARIKVYETSN